MYSLDTAPAERTFIGCCNKHLTAHHNATERRKLWELAETLYAHHSQPLGLILCSTGSGDPYEVYCCYIVNYRATRYAS